VGLMFASWAIRKEWKEHYPLDWMIEIEE
jgi:hypothetical protein